MTSAAITHKPDDERFVLESDGKRLGYLSYSLTKAQLTIDYVFVDPSLRGTGTGNRLVDAAVAWARETGRSVDATCSVARRVLATSSRRR